MPTEFHPPKVLPPHYFVLAILAIVLVGWVAPGDLYGTGISLIGLLPVAAGISLALRASRQFKQADTNIIPLSKSTALVTDGAFQVSRNPMYTGMLLTLAGIAWMTASVWPWLIVLLFFTLIRQLFVLREEDLMAETFGDDYLGYKERVRRWV